MVVYINIYVQYEQKYIHVYLEQKKKEKQKMLNTPNFASLAR